MNGNERAAILVVDDEPSVSDILSRWLVSAGHAAAHRRRNGGAARRPRASIGGSAKRRTCR